MSIADRKIKNIEVRVKDSSGKVRAINLIEHDIVNLKFKSPDTGKVIQIETGEIIKIGINASNNTYLTIFSYNYTLDNNLFYVPTSSLTQIISVNHSSEQYTLTPIYSSDESVAVLRSNDNCLEYTVNGKDWIKCGGGGGSDITIDDVDREIEKYLVDYPSDEEVDSKISEAVTGFVTGEEVDTKISEATADFVTEAQVGSIVDEKVAEATTDFVTGEEVDSKISEATADFVTESTVVQIVDQATAEFVTEGQVTTIVDEKVAEATADFVTGEQVDEKIATATADFITGEVVDEKIATATADFVTESTVVQIVDQATADFITGEQVDTKIAEAVVDFVTESEVTTILDEKVAEATVDFVTGEQVDEKIATATADFVTESRVTEIVDQATADFVTMTQVEGVVDDKIAEAVADFVTAEQVAEQISEATIDFITTAEVDTKIAEATADFTTFDDVNQILEEYPTEDDMDRAIEDALVDYAPIENPTFIGEVKVPTQDQSVNNDIAASTSYVRTAITDLKTQLSGALHFKGVVDTFDDLPTENEEGDVWQVRSSEFGNDLEFVWTLNAGTGEGKWVELGTFVDLSAYPTRNEMVSAIETAEGNANAYTDEKIAAIDPYLLAKEQGYSGTVEEFYAALAEALNNISNIVINEQIR